MSLETREDNKFGIEIFQIKLILFQRKKKSNNEIEILKIQSQKYSF